MTSDDIATILGRWRDGALDAPGVKAWLEGAGGVAALHSGTRSPASALAPAAREALDALDLLEVHLLTADDVPALLALLHGGAGAIASWTRYRDAIDLDARSRTLKRNRFYRPFCR